MPEEKYFYFIEFGSRQVRTDSFLTHCNDGFYIPDKVLPFGTKDRAFLKSFFKLIFRHILQINKDWIDIAFSRVKVGIICRFLKSVPGADILTDITAEDPVIHFIMIFIRDRFIPHLDSQIRDTLCGIQLIRDKRIGRASINAGCAIATIIFNGCVIFKFNI